MLTSSKFVYIYIITIPPLSVHLYIVLFFILFPYLHIILYKNIPTFFNSMISLQPIFYCMLCLHSCVAAYYLATADTMKWPHSLNAGYERDGQIPGT
jgi:hypothetical protein